MTTASIKETPLASAHKALGARMVDFAGWNMPVQYKSIISEHMAVRTKAGLFDVSHMGEFIIKGAGAFDFVQYMIANDLQKLPKPNMALYTQFVMPHGGTVDDLIVYRRENDFLLVVNASNIDKDWQWLEKHARKFDVNMENISDATALLALQGPNAALILSKFAKEQVSALPSFCYGTGIASGVEIGFGRTGYTGEDGFEIFCAAEKSPILWDTLLEAGKEFGIEPCGLGARDTLRLEAGLPLYGHELDEETSPLESGLGWSVKLDKQDFLGKDALVNQKQNGLSKQCVCLVSEGKQLPRQGYEVYAGDKKIGIVSSGSQGIFVGKPIAFAFVPPQFATIGQALTIEIRGNKIPASVVRRPFYKRAR
jgi:aminomethyltransferase